MKKKLNLFRFSIILIIICVISYTGVVISLLSSNIDFRDLNKMNINFGTIFDRNYRYSYNVNSTESSALDNIDTLNLDFISGDINIQTSDKNEVSVTVIGDIRTDEILNTVGIKKEVSNKQVTFSLSNDKNTLLDLIYLNNVSITVTIPNNFNKNLIISSTSSYINISNNNFNTIDIKTISGDLELSNVNSKNISSTSTSGSISFNNVNVESSINRNVSGNIFAQNFSGNLDCKTVSGDINIDFTKLNSDYKFSTVSADTTLTIPSSHSFTLASETLSGSIFNDFGSDTNSTSKIQFNSTSGNLSINKK